jgi:penicillin-binding protein 2
MGGIVLLAFTIVAVRLWALQIREGPSFREKSVNNFFQRKRIEHERGQILDRKGRLLVTNRPAVNVYVTPAFFPNARRAVLRLAASVGVARRRAEELSRALSKVVSEGGPPILIKDRLDGEQIRMLRRAQRRLDLPIEAVVVMRSGKRHAAYIDPENFPSVGLVLDRVVRLAGLGPEARARLARRVRRARGLARYRDLLVRRDAPPEVQGTLSTEIQLGNLPGVTLRTASARLYRHGATAAHLLGYVNEVTGEELERKRELGYRLGDEIGRRGVERAFEDDLRGTDGFETVVVDSKGRTQRSDLAESLLDQVGARVPPRAGNRVVLTVDLELQQAAEEAFDDRAGSVVVMEVKTGRLLAMTSTPAFDPNKLAGTFDQAEKARLDALAPARPWRFRAIQDHFAPGSTFKVITALAGLEAGKIHRKSATFCPGFYRLGRARFRCWKDHGHGWTGLVGSLEESCDVFYYALGARLGLDPIADMARRFGLGRPTGIDLDSEASGIIPDQDWYDRHLPEGYTLGAAVNASIGQGAVAVTPLQLAVLYGAIANGGTVWVPRVASRIERWDGKLLHAIEPEVATTVDVDPEHLALVQEGLRRVVNARGGTAYGKRLESVEVAGKTGTAQVARLGRDRRKSRDASWKLRDHAWFAAYAPVGDPEVVVVVFDEHGGGGSSSAAPIAMRVLEAWHRLSRSITAAAGPMEGKP